MTVMNRHLPGIILLLAAAPAFAADDAEVRFERWYAMRLMDRPVGWAHEKVVQRGDRIISTSRTRMSMKRGPQTVNIRMGTTFIETEDGRPIESRVLQDVSATKSKRVMKFTDDGIELSVLEGDRHYTKTLAKPKKPWRPPAAMGRYLEKQMEKGDKKITVSTIDPQGSTKVMDVTWVHGGEENIEVVGKTVPATLWLVTVSIMPSIVTRQYVDEKGQTLKTTVRLLPGIELEMVEADKQVATAQVDPPELVMKTLVRADRPIEHPRRTRWSVFEVKFDKPEDAVDFSPQLPRGGSQRVVWNDQHTAIVAVQLDDPVNPKDDLPGDAHRNASAVLDSDDEKIRDLTGGALAGAKQKLVAAQKAERLRRFVYRYVNKKDLAIGFATASEVARTRQGDCSEHAVLLAAMLRAADIPSRTVSGLIYADGFLGQRGVFGYHMWTQAWLDGDQGGEGGRWVDLDATLADDSPFDATHIALARSALDDATMLNDMVSMVPMIGRLKIRIVEIDPVD